MIYKITALFVCVFVTACGGETPQQKTEQVVISLGSLQCSGGGKTLDELERKLTSSGIAVSSKSCGSDGKVYPAVCGAADGKIGIFEIPFEQIPRAKSEGFVELKDLPSAVKTSC